MGSHLPYVHPERLPADNRFPSFVHVLLKALQQVPDMCETFILRRVLTECLEWALGEQKFGFPPPRVSLHVKPTRVLSGHKLVPLAVSYLEPFIAIRATDFSSAVTTPAASCAPQPVLLTVRLAIQTFLTEPQRRQIVIIHAIGTGGGWSDWVQSPHRI